MELLSCAHRQEFCLILDNLEKWCDPPGSGAAGPSKDIPIFLPDRGKMNYR